MTMRAGQQAKREARRLFGGCLVDGVLDENRARQATEVTLAASRRDAPHILSYFLRLVRFENARHTAQVESVRPLPADLRSAIETSLQRRYGGRLTTRFSQRPDLIGGLRIQVGSDLYDSSVRAGLAALEKSF